jgi:hypothetical protein
MQPTGQPTGQAIRKIKLWIKVFIPNTGAEVTVVAGSGAHAGKTAVSIAWFGSRCFLTDQRGFSSDIHAEARMHSEIEIDLAKGKETYQFHHCYDTIEVACKTGEERCRGQGDTSQMQFHDIEIAPDRTRARLKIKAGSKNPCVRIGVLKVAPNVDYTGAISIEISDDQRSAIVTFQGKVERYPAFEMYASANDGEPYTVFRVDAAPESGIRDLPGAPERPVYGRAEIRG